MDFYLEISKYQNIETIYKFLKQNKTLYLYYQSEEFWKQRCLSDFSINGDFYDYVSRYQQNLAIKYVSSGRNIFITGQAGTGKSFLVRRLREVFKRIKLTSSTGVSAFLIGATTFHSFFGIGTGNYDKDKLYYQVMKKDWIKYNIETTKTLIIDEVSMLSSDIFEKVNYICKRIRRNTCPFGGIQLILVGDFFQLPPVKEDKMLFESDTWRELNLTTIHLKKIYRQNETFYSSILSRVRNGTFTNQDVKMLRQRVLEPPENIPHVYCKKSQVEELNNKKIDSITEESFTFIIETMIKTSKNTEQVKKKASSKETDMIKELPFGNIELKIGARVMLKVNLDVSKGLVNGSIGTIIDFQGSPKIPVVKFDNGVLSAIQYFRYEYEEEDFLISIKGIPLILAWAFTVHSIQGCTLEKALVDITTCFTIGQAYVALSRVSKWDGLYLTEFYRHRVMTSTKVKEYYETI